MNPIGTIYLLFWSVLAICLGLVGIFNRKWIINSNIAILLFLYRFSNFSLFKKQAEGMKEDYMQIMVVLLGIIFTIVGVIELLKII